MALDSPAQPERRAGALEPSQNISREDLASYQASIQQGGKAPKAEFTPKQALELKPLWEREMAAFAADRDGRTDPDTDPHLKGKEKERFDRLMEQARNSKALQDAGKLGTDENRSQPGISKQDLDNYARSLELSGLKGLFNRCVQKNLSEFDVDTMRKEIKSEGLKPESPALMAALDALAARDLKQRVRPLDVADVYNKVDAQSSGTSDGSFAFPGISEVIEGLRKINHGLERRP
jgi:hypothetical protein